jgi:hypothetical protein
VKIFATENREITEGLNKILSVISVFSVVEIYITIQEGSIEIAYLYLFMMIKEQHVYFMDIYIELSREGPYAC